MHAVSVQGKNGIARIMSSRHKFLLPFALVSYFESKDGITSIEANALKHACLDKLKFRWRPEAIRHVLAFAQKLNSNSHFGIYKCNLCNGWHFTHSVLDDALNVSSGSRHVRHNKRKKLEFLSVLEKIDCKHKVQIVC